VTTLLLLSETVVGSSSSSGGSISPTTTTTTTKTIVTPTTDKTKAAEDPATVVRILNTKEEIQQKEDDKEEEEEKGIAVDETAELRMATKEEPEEFQPGNDDNGDTIPQEENDDDDNEEEEEEEENNEDEEEEESEVSSSSTSTEDAQSLRSRGKEAHDEGDFEKAADLFSQAAQLLSTTLDELKKKDDGTSSEKMIMMMIQETTTSAEEYATCRLHQALCYLKAQEYEKCLDACSGLLESPPSSFTRNSNPFSSAVRARAYHRRAKARLGLGGMSALALEDARSAAFLGDSKAVQLYGKLMRQVGGNGGGGGSSSGSIGGSTSDSLLHALLSKSTTSIDSGDDHDETITRMKSAFDPTSLLLGTGGTNGGSLASTILNSLTGKGGGGGNNKGGGASSSLASSVLNSLSKRLDDPITHTSVATFLQKTTKEQITQYFTMAGLAIPDPYVEKLESFCQAITSRKIYWTIKFSRMAIFTTQYTRRLLKLLRKYRSLLLFVIILQWTKSAVLRPIPIDRAAAKKLAKQELRKAMKGNRGMK